MMSRVRTATLLALVGATAMASGAATRLGGFGIQVVLPDANDARQRGAILIVRPVGCMGPGAKVSASAEGLVSGRRVTVPLALRQVARGTEHDPFDTYAIRRQWPTAGAWVVLTKATSGSMETWAVAEMSPKGGPRTVASADGRGSREVVVHYAWQMHGASPTDAVNRTLADMRRQTPQREASRTR